MTSQLLYYSTNDSCQRKQNKRQQAFLYSNWRVRTQPVTLGCSCALARGYLHLKGFGEPWGDEVKARLAAMQAAYGTGIVNC
jgi:hypothetical protein